MVIERVEIHRFGKLTNFKTDLDPYFNLIEGPNESGKSTLAAFIFYMLYGFCDASEDAYTERVLRTPWDGEQIAGAMTVASGGKRYRIERTSFLDKDGKRDSFRMTDLDEDTTETGGVAPGERFLGIPREVFANTAFIDTPSFGKVDGDAMTAAIENIIFSADEKLSVVRAMLALKQVGNQIISPDGRGGTVISLEKQKDELEERLVAARAREEELIEKENLLYATHQKRLECAKELAKFHRLETDYHNAVLIRDYDRLHELEDTAEARERAIEDYEKSKRKNGFLPDATYLTDLATAKGGMDAASARLTQTAENLRKEEEKPFPISEEEKVLLNRLREAGDEDSLREQSAQGEKNKKMAFILFFLCSFGALLFSALAVVSGLFLGVAMVVIAAVFAFASLAGGAVFFAKHAKGSRALLLLYDVGNAVNREEFAASLALARDAETRLHDYEAAISLARSLAKAAEEEYAAAQNKLQSVMDKWSDSAKADEQYADAVKVLSHAVGEHLQQVASLYLARENADNEVRALRTQLKGHDEIAVRALVPPDKRAVLCNHNASDLRHGVEHYEKMLQSFTEKEEDLCAKLAALPRKEGSAEVAEEIMELDRRLHTLREKASVCRNTEDKIRGGLDRLRTEISPRLSVYACGLLDELTDGKYTELHITDDLKLSVTAEGEARHVAYLSHGTKELTYISLRMALLDLLYKEQPPVCFDDTAAHQDDERAATFMQSLRSLVGEGKQCFLFTCRERDRHLADHIFASYGRVSLG